MTISFKVFEKSPMSDYIQPFNIELEVIDKDIKIYQTTVPITVKKKIEKNRIFVGYKNGILLKCFVNNDIEPGNGILNITLYGYPSTNEIDLYNNMISYLK